MLLALKTLQPRWWTAGLAGAWSVCKCSAPTRASHPCPRAPALPPPQPAFHISLTTAHSGVWEVQRPAGILQALVGLGSLWLMPWNVGLQPDTGSNLSRALALWEP